MARIRFPLVGKVLGFIWLPPYMHRAAVAHLCGFIILIQDLCVDPVQLFSWKQAQKLPPNIQGIDDRQVVVGILADEPLLKGLSEFQILLIQRESSSSPITEARALASPTLA